MPVTEKMPQAQNQQFYRRDTVDRNDQKKILDPSLDFVTICPIASHQPVKEQLLNLDTFKK